MSGGYRIETIERCKLIFGDLPLSDMAALSGLAGEGAIMDVAFADRVGATVVFGQPEDVARLRLRDDLPPSQKRLDEADYARSLGLPISVQKWLLNGERGSSSNEMCHVFFGIPARSKKSHPLDVDDFRRCLLFLVATNSRSELPKMVSVSSEWAAIIAKWDEIEELSVRAEYGAACDLIDACLSAPVIE